MRDQFFASLGRDRGFGLTVSILIMVGVSIVADGARADVLRVVPGGLGSGDCSTWPVACELQYAMGVATSGDELWVAAGTYLPGAARDDAFELAAGVELYGGFNGTETQRSQRDWEVNITILSGDIGVPGDNSDNCYHVVVFTTADTTAVVDGFTITAGKTSTSWPDYHGAGVYGLGGGATLRNVLITGNSAYYHGGGIYNEGGVLVVDRAVIEYNEITGPNGDGGCVHGWSGELGLTNSVIGHCNGRLGGGVYSFSAVVELTDVEIEWNTASNSGGGMSTSYSATVTLTRVRFAHNSAPYGGGMSNSNQDGATTLADVIFLQNTATNEGGGMNNQADAALTNVVFQGNSAQDGGGLRNYGINTNQTTIVSNALFVGNTASSEGGGCFNEIADDAGSFHLLNATFAGNEAASRGGGLCNYGSSAPGGGADALIANSVFFGNSAPTGGQIGMVFDDITVTYSDVSGGYTGSGNIDADPLFERQPSPGADAIWGTADDDYGDLHIDDVSPVIDAGDTTMVVAPMDLDGGLRVTDMPTVPDTGVGSPVVDMGVYEAGLIFMDGFESADTSRWSATGG